MRHERALVDWHVDGAPEAVVPVSTLRRPSGAGDKNACERCGVAGDAFDVALCCLLGEPKSPAECLWCGEDLPTGRTFCGRGCSREYHHDRLEEVAAPDRRHRRVRGCRCVACVRRCPACSAPPGRPCVRREGGRTVTMHSPHTARRA